MRLVVSAGATTVVEVVAGGDPAPLGLSAFAVTTFAFSVTLAGLVGDEVVNLFIPLALIFGGLVQLLAGMWEFKNQNTFGATAFSSYGGFWISFGILEVFARQLGIAEEQVPVALAWFFLAWTVFTVYMCIGSWGINAALGITFTVLLAVFILLAVSEFAQSEGLRNIAGYLGIVGAIGAWYIAAADVFNDTYGRAILPVGPAAGRGN